MTKEECLKIIGIAPRVYGLIEGDLIHVTSQGNEWMRARFIWEYNGRLFFFTSEGKETLLNTPYIITKLPEEDEDTSQEDTV